MNTKTLEGLVGARTSTDLMDTPMRVFDEARGRGDTAVMERALRYAGELADKAEDYKTKADKGMEEEAKEAREKARAEREAVIQKCKEERGELEQRIDESRGAVTDTVEISAEGKDASKEELAPDAAGTGEKKHDAVGQAVTYTKTGEVIHMEPDKGMAVSV